MAFLWRNSSLAFAIGGEMMKKIKVLRSLPQNATVDEMSSPVGKLMIITSEMGLHAILWDVEHHFKYVRQVTDNLKHSRNEKTIVKTKKQLLEYFENKRKQFDLPLIMNGTPFQTQAWRQLLQIPYGKTISYGNQAEKIGNKNLARAIGMANRSNPISIIIPCHRVIGCNGDLVGFSGGLEKKSYLLAIEKNQGLIT